MPLEERTRPSAAPLAGAAAWLAIAAASAVLLLRSSRPFVLLFAGAVLAFVLPETDEPGWHGFVPASLLRIGDTLVFGALGWSVGRLDGDLGGAAAGATLLAAALISPYVRVRAQALAIPGGHLAVTGTAGERTVRLTLVGIGLAGPLVPLLWTAAGYSLALAAVRSGGIWRGASHG